MCNIDINLMIVLSAPGMPILGKVTLVCKHLRTDTAAVGANNDKPVWMYIDATSIKCQMHLVRREWGHGRRATNTGMMRLSMSVMYSLVMCLPRLWEWRPLYRIGLA